MSSNKMKQASKQNITYFNKDEGKSIVTSFSLPIWNKKRLLAISKKLKRNGYNISTKQIMMQALQIIMTKLKRENQKPLLNRAVRYNQTTSAYETIALRMNPQEYNSLHDKKMIMKVSLSYLLDLALRLYLGLILNLYLKRKKRIITCISYYKKIIKFTLNSIIFEEKVEFFIRI